MKLERVLSEPAARAELTVKCLTEPERARWDAFVERCPQAGFFHHSAWAGLIENCFGHATYFLFAERAGVIEGILPLAWVNSWITGRALVSLPFCIEAGVAAETPEAADALAREASVIARQLGAGHLELRHTRRAQPQWPCQDLYVRFARAMGADDAENLAAIPRKQRAMVRKGIAAGLRAFDDAGLERFFRLYANNMARHGTPALPRRFFEALQAAFGERCGVLTVCAPNGEALSSVLSFYFRDTVMPYYAGDLPAARGAYANDFKYWALMQQAAARGVRWFDYGRSKQGSGSYAFKKNWGFVPQPLFYEYCFFDGRRDPPQHNPNNPRYRALIATWKRLPLPLATWLGARVVRHFG